MRSRLPILHWPTSGERFISVRTRGIASLQDTALLGLNLGLLTAFYHAVALLGTAGVDPEAVAAVASDYLPFATGLLPEHARQAAAGEYPADEGSLAVLAAAVDHLVATSRKQGVGTDVPEGIAALVRRGLAAGHDGDGLASMVGVIAAAGPVRAASR